MGSRKGSYSKRSTETGRTAPNSIATEQRNVANGRANELAMPELESAAPFAGYAHQRLAGRHGRHVLFTVNALGLFAYRPDRDI
jgi:hypothetical protein